MDELDSKKAEGESSVESLLAQWLARKDAGERVEVDDLCRANPQHAQELRRLAGNLMKFDNAVAAAPAASGDDSGAAFLRAANDRDRYETLEGIGRGAMGEVVAVRDRFLPRTLAMKVALDKVEASQHGAASSRTIRRFLREAEILAELDHPGIVPVHDLGIRADGRPYFTMRRIQGRDLRAIFTLVAERRENWTATRALHVLLRVCETMAFAHSRGVIHRDLKPANIMVGDFGEVYVVDWGLAKRAGRAVAPEIAAAAVLGAANPASNFGGTGFGDVIGTPAYMPPEQARGATDELDERADVYAVGAILYELVAGFAPYCEAGQKVPAHALIARILDGPPRCLSTLGARLPSELVAIAEKAMARDIAGRYANMRALAVDLQAYLETRVVAAYETGTWAETKKWVRRNKALAVAWSATLVVVVVGAVAFPLQRKVVAAQESAKAARAGRGPLADAFSEMGTVLRTAGRYDEALEALGSSVGLRERTVFEDPENRPASLALWQTHVQIGRALVQSGKISEASIPMQLARQGLEQLERESVDDRDLGVAMIGCLVDLAKASVATSAPRDVLDLSDQAVKCAERVLEHYPDDSEVRAAAAGSYLNRAQQSVLEREPAEVEADRDRAIEMYRDLLGVTPADFNRKLGLVTALMIETNFQPGAAPDPAEDARMDEAIKLMAEMHEARPANQQLAMQLIHVRDERGISYMAARALDRAQECFQANADLIATIADQSPPDARCLEEQARAWGRVGLVAQAQQDGPLMRQHYENAVAGWRKITQGRDPQDVSFDDLADSLSQLGTAQHLCLDFDAARVSIGEAIAIRSRMVDSNPDDAVRRVQLHICYSAMVRACNAAEDETAQLEWLAKVFRNFEELKRLSPACAELVTDIEELTEVQRTLQEK